MKRIRCDAGPIQINIGGIKTNGIDLSTHYKLPSTSVGDFKLGLDITFLKSYLQTIPNAGSPSGFSRAGSVSE